MYGIELQAKVISYTSELDHEPDDDGKYGGEYINGRALKATKYLDVGGEFSIHGYEIKEISIID